MSKVDVKLKINDLKNFHLPCGLFSSWCNSGVISLLRPLLLDVVPTIQQTAALALGRLAYFNDDLAEAVVKEGILPQLVFSLSEQNVRHHCFLK